MIRIRSIGRKERKDANNKNIEAQNPKHETRNKFK